MKKICLLPVFIFLFVCQLFPQKEKNLLDSLLQLKETASSDTLKISLLNQIADLQKKSGEQAAEYAYKALELSKKLDYKQGIIESYFSLGLVYSYQSNLDISQEYYQKALDLSLQKGDAELIAKAYNRMALISKYKSKYDLALQYYKKRLDWNFKSGDSVAIAHSYKDIGSVYRNQGDYKKALENYHLALNISDAAAYTRGVALCYNSIGIVYKSQGLYKQALDFYFKSLKIKEELGNRESIAASYNNIGILYAVQENYQKALEFHFKSLEIKKEVNDQPGIASSYNNIGEIYYQTGKYDAALEYLEKSLVLKQKMNYSRGIANSLQNIGLVYEKLNQYEQAYSNFLEAFEIRKKIGDKKGLAYSYRDIGNYFLIKKEHQTAIENLKQAMNLAQKIGAIEIIEDAAKLLSEAYSKQNKYEQAFRYHVLYKQMNDSLSNEENAKKITRLQMQYEYDQKEKIRRLEQQKHEAMREAELQRQKMYRNVSFGGIVFLLLLAFVLLRGYRMKQKANRLLAKQKQQIAEKNEELEQQKEEIQSQAEQLEQTNKVLESKNVKIERQNEHIKGSIRYARTIQNAILSIKTAIDDVFENFIIFRPKDIVSGDFYWFFHLPDDKSTTQKTFIAVVDCTGHGVPGAFMSVIGNSLLNKIVKEKGVYDPKIILDLLNKGILQALKQHLTDNNDGMDVCMCLIENDMNTSNKNCQRKITYCGAKRPLFYFNNKEKTIKRIKGCRKSIGGARVQSANIEFKNKTLLVEKDDMLYFITDGYTDQNGPKRNKIGTGKFMQIVEQIAPKPVAEQKQFLETFLDEHQAEAQQRDDITVVGIRI